jgi:hypothetical protein
MSKSDENIIEQIKAGGFDLAELEQSFSNRAASNLVTVTDWAICYSSATGQLSQYAAVTSNSVSDPITGLGMLAYSGNGATMFCLQYNNGYNDTALNISIGTALYTTSMGNTALCVIYGWTQSGSFYIPQTMTIGSC